MFNWLGWMGEGVEATAKPQVNINLCTKATLNTMYYCKESHCMVPISKHFSGIKERSLYVRISYG